MSKYYEQIKKEMSQKLIEEREKTKKNPFNEQLKRELDKSCYYTRKAIFEKWRLEKAKMIKEMSVACRNKH